MNSSSSFGRKIRHCGTAAILLAAAASLAPMPASAGECPADQVGVGVMQPGATEPEGVTDTVLASIDLDTTTPGMDGHLFRMRRLVVEPGGVVPWHSHEMRPASIYVVEGSITEYRSTCKVPIEHKAGEVTAEFGALSHWWKNNGNVPAVLISADIFHEEMKDDHMM